MEQEMGNPPALESTLFASLILHKSSKFSDPIVCLIECKIISNICKIYVQIQIFPIVCFIECKIILNICKIYVQRSSYWKLIYVINSLFFFFFFFFMKRMRIRKKKKNGLDLLWE